MGKTAKIDMTNPAAVLETLKSGNDYCPKLVTSSVRSLATAGKKYDARAHATACAILSRAINHNDASLMHELVNGLARSARRNDLVDWFHHYSNFRLVKDSPKATTYKPAKLLPKGGKLWRDDLPIDSFARPFYSVEEAKRPSNPFDDKRFAAAVAKLIKRAEDDNATLSPAAKAALADLKVTAQKLQPAE